MFVAGWLPSRAHPLLTWDLNTWAKHLLGSKMENFVLSSLWLKQLGNLISVKLSSFFFSPYCCRLSSSSLYFQIMKILLNSVKNCSNGTFGLRQCTQPTHLPPLYSHVLDGQINKHDHSDWRHPLGPHVAPGGRLG